MLNIWAILGLSLLAMPPARGGIGRFWAHDLDSFENARVYGTRLIAP
jgi:hypothetical protein